MHQKSRMAANYADFHMAVQEIRPSQDAPRKCHINEVTETIKTQEKK